MKLIRKRLEEARKDAGLSEGKTGDGSLFYNPTDSVNYWEKKGQPVETRLLYQGGFDYE